MSQELGLCYCVAACWPSKCEASHCTWTSAVGRCLCRGRDHFLVIPDWTFHLQVWGGHEGPGKLLCGGVASAGGWGRGERAEVSLQNSGLALLRPPHTCQ